MIKKYILQGTLLILLIGLGLDLFMPIKRDFKKFDPVLVGHLDAAMWRSYYEKRSVKLFLQLGELIRSQFHAPVVRSYLMAYYSGKAAFVFKKGTNREEYLKALPYLIRYFKALQNISDTSFDYETLAKTELEWWIIRREPEKYNTEDWKILLGSAAETMYHIPANRFGTYADQRVRAMVMRDNKGTHIAEKDWAEIDGLCVEAWRSFDKVLR